MARYKLTPLYWREDNTLNNAIEVIDSWQITHTRYYVIPTWKARTPFSDWCSLEEITPDQIDVENPRLITATHAATLRWE
jgi:hypothetical protein